MRTPTSLSALLARTGRFFVAAWSWTPMMLSMLPVRQHHQIFRAVVGALTIDVMHYLAWFQRCAMRLFPDYLMFWDIAFSISAGMLGRIEHSVAFTKVMAAFPLRVLRTRQPAHVVAFDKGGAATVITLLALGGSAGYGAAASAGAKGAFFNTMLGGILSHNPSITQVSIVS